MNCKLPQITRETIDVVKNLGERFAIDYYRKNNLSNFASFKDMMNNNSILFSEAKLLEVVEKFLPKNSFQVKHLNNIIQNLPADSQAAFFKDVLYFGDNVTKEQIAEETFHAIFQRVIPNSLRDKYLEEGRSLIENIEKSKKDYLENYPKASLLNEKQLEERVIEEAIAKKYVEYFNNNISPSNKKGILKLLDNFFKWLKDLFNNLRNGDNLEILFNNILKGKFTKSTIQNTNESEVPTLRLITYMGKDMNGSDEQKNLTVKESEFLISALGSIVIGLNNLKVETLQKLNLTNRARRIQFAIEKLREVYAKEGKNNNPKFVSALSQHTTKVLNKEATSIKDRIIKTELPNLKNLAEDVNNYLNIVTGVEIKNAEIDEDEVAEVNYGDMIAANERGFEGMSAWLRGYIATTGSFEDSFEVEGESVDVLRPIDKNKVYYSLARSMQNTTHELERLYKLVTIGSFNTNTETRLLIDRVIKDVMNYNLSDENERFKKFKEDVTSLYNTWKSNKKKHHYIINTLPNLNKEKSYILQTILQGFDLWKRDNYKVELEFKSGTYHTKVYEANQNSASKVQLEMWQNKWEETIANPQEKARVRKILESYARKIDSLIDNKTITKANLDDILNTIFYDVDDSYLTYLLDSDTNNSLGGTFTGTATLEDVKKIFEIALKETDTNNKESNLFLSGDKGARARIEKFAVNVSKINEKVIESTYKDAENKTRYSYQNKTFQLYMFNEIFNMNNIDYYLGDIMEKQMYEYAEGKFLEQASTFLYKGENNSLNHIIFSDDLWKKSFVNGDFYSVDGLDGGVGSSTFGGMTNRDFLLWKLHLKAFKTKGVNKDNSGNFEYFTQPIHINLMEAKRTASFKEVRVIEGLFKDGEITDLAIDLFGKEIKKEVYRMYEEKSKILNWLKILAKDLEDGEHVIKLERKNVIAKGKVSDGEGIIEKYHTGEYKIEKKENDIKIISGGGRALQFTDNVKNLLSKETYNSIISNVFITESIDKNTVIPTISRELKSQLNEYIKEYESVIKELKGVLPSSSDTRYKNLNEIVNGKNFNRDGFLNDELSSWLNTTWVNQLINSDSALLVKNDGADFVKRAGGQNAAIASLSTTFYSDKLKGINKFDKIKYIVGNDPQGIISFKTDEKVDSADAQSYMTVDAYLKYLHSTSKLTSESSEILFKIKDGIPLTEKDRKYLKENDIFFNVIKPVGYDGYFYFKTGTVMLTKNMTSILVIKDGKEVWIAKPGREALHNLREKMEATGVDYYLGQTASKQLTINKYTEDFDNIGFNGKEEIDEIWNGSTNVMSTKFFGQQMENPAGKEKIIDPSQMLEIILNEQELNGATFDIMLNGQKFPIGEILKKWQALSINRVSLTFQEAMNEIADDNLIIQSDKFIKKVQDVLASSGADDQLLEIFSLDKDGKPLYNLNMSVSVDKFINLLMSHFTKGVFQQKVAGDAMALISPHGMNVIKKIIKHETIDGKIVYSWKVIRESDSEYNKALNSKLHRLENIAEYDEFDNKSQLKGGSSELINTLASLYDENKDVYFVDQLRFGKPVYTFNEDGLVEGVEYYGAEAILPKHKEGINVDELNKMFGLRIPSQDKQSAVNLIWVDELASYYGNTISVPKEIQYLSGSDYDIDKLYIHRKETFEKDGKEIVWGIEHNTFEMYKYYHTTGNSLVRKRIKELIKEDEYLSKLKIKLNSILKELEDFKEDPELYTLSFYTKDIVEKINNSDEEEQEKYYEELEKIQNQFDNLDANLKSAKILELKALIKASKDSVKDGINYVKDVLTGIAFKEFKLITKEKEFNERKEKEGILILPIINNEMLELKLRLLTNDATLDRSKGEAVSLTPATQDNLKKFIAKTYIIENGKPFYLFKTKKGDDEFTTEIKHATHSTLGQHIAHKNVVTGKRNIGVAVVANLLHLFSKKANIVVYKDVLIEDVTPSLSKNDGLHELVEHRLSKFNISRNVKDQRIADIISELISAATDEVKDQQNAKYGLTMEALNIVTPILMLGGSLDFAIRLINTSSVREYLNKVSMKDNIVKTEDEKSELQASNETILNNLLGGYIPSEKPLSIVDLKKGVANKEALAFASKMLAISREIGMANYVIGLKKGLKKTIEEFEDGESKIESTTKEKPNPLQMTNMSLVFKQENENLEIYQEQIKLHKILSEFFNNNIVSRKNQFQILKYHFINNFKPATYDKARKWVNDNMVSFIYSRLYFNYLDKRLNLNDDKFEEYTKAKLEDVEKEWTDFVNKIKSKDSSLGISNELIEDISKNPLITKLKKNTKGRIYAPTFIKSDIATNVSLLESFYDLHMKLINTDESLGYNNLMWKLFHYSVHKDGWTFKGGSLSKVIPPVFFTSHSKSLDEFVKNPSTYNGEYSNGYLAYIAIERAMQTKDGTSYIKEANRKDDDLWGRLFKNETISLETIENLKQQDQTWLLDRGYIVADVKGNIFPQFPLYHKFRIPKTDGSGKLESVIHRMEKLNVLFDDKITREITPEQYFDNINRVEKVLEIKYKIWSNTIKKENIDENMINLPIRKGIKIEKLDIGERVEEKQISSQQSTDANKGIQQPVNTNLTAEQPSTKKDFVRTKGYFILTNYEQGYDGSFLNYKVYNSNNEKLFYVYKDDSRIDIPDIIFREFNQKGINISKDDIENMIKNVDKNNEIYKELKQSEKQTDENQPDITKQQQKIPLDVVQDNVLFDSSLPKVNIYAGTGENADLSNFAIRPFKFQVQSNNNAGYAGEKTFQSVEQAFQWHKVQYADIIGMGARNRNEIAQDILNTTDGGKLRKLGKDFYLTKFKSKWDNVSSYIMKELLKASFEQNPDALAKLLATGNAELTHKYNNAEQDKGRFSKLLMEVRQELTQQQQEMPLNVVQDIIPLQSDFTRESIKNDSNYLYLFTDNAERASGTKNVDLNSWYAKKYQTDKRLLTYPSKTQAVARGLNNAYPITTMVDDKRTQWKDEQFEEYKKIIDDEIETIKQAIPNYKGIKFGGQMQFGKGQISDMKNSAPKIWNYLNIKLAEIGIDNTGDKPIAIKIKSTDIEQQKKTEPQIDSLPWENKDSLTDIKQKSKDEPYLIFSKDGVDYYMNDQQKAAFDFLVENIKKRMENNPPVYTSSFEDRMIFESPLTKSFSDIIPKELYNNMFGLQGFGGTGKTTISKKLLAALLDSDNVFSGKTVKFVAPTHIASTQLQEALEVDSEGIEKVSTIAKYLRLEPKGNQITEESFVPKTEEDYIKTYRYMTPVGSPDIIVIDESSMLGTDDMKLFIQRMITDYNQGVMREFPIMLFLGDYHQLPPIESSKDNQNKLGIISSLILKNKQKSPVLTQVMRSDDKELADLYLSVANQIDKYLDSVEKEKNYEMSASDFKDFLKRDNTNILSFTGNTPKSIEALIDEYVDYLVKNDYPDGMFWLHYNRLGNSDTQEMLRKIRLKYLQKFDKNLKILPDNYIKNDYVTADVGLPFYTPLLKIPDNIIPKDSLFYKLNKSDNLKNGIRIISEGIIKPKSRYKIIEQIVNRPISLEELQEAFNGEEGSFFNDKNIKRVFKDAKVDIDLLYNRQKRIRGLFSFTNIVLEKQEVYYGNVRKDGSRSKLGLEYFFYNSDTKETGSFKVLFNDKEKFQTILATIKDENNKDKRSKGAKIFSPSYIGSSHSYQGAGINNVVGDSTNVLKYLGKGGIHQLDIMASLYTIITRTKNRLIVIGDESGYNAKNWSGLKMDEQPFAEKDKLPNDTSPFDDNNFKDLTNDNPPSCV